VVRDSKGHSLSSGGDPASRLRRIAVTGADGYIGRHVIERLRGAAIHMSRRKPATQAQWVKFELSDPTPSVPPGVGVIIHLAADIRLALTAEQELAGLQGLIAAAKRECAALIYVSSQSAKRPLGEYGQRKAAAEKLVAEAGGTIVRPGLVVGGRRPKGLAAQLVQLSRMPLLPDLGPRAQVQPIHVGTLADALVELARSPRSGVIELGGELMTFRRLITQFGETRRGAAPRFVRIPTGLIEAACGTARRGARASLRQMLQLQPLTDDLPSLGLVPPDLRVIAMPSNRPLRRALLAEGKALLKCVGCARPRAALLRRYARVLEEDVAPAPADLQPLRRLGPAVVAARYERADLDELRRRLDLALALFEFTPEGAAAGMRFRTASWIGTLVRLALLGPAAAVDLVRIGLASRGSSRS
jgi:nucleoside-diphosphate-sugar epimerase